MTMMKAMYDIVNLSTVDNIEVGMGWIKITQGLTSRTMSFITDKAAYDAYMAIWEGIMSGEKYFDIDAFLDREGKKLDENKI